MVRLFVVVFFHAEVSFSLNYSHLRSSLSPLWGPCAQGTFFFDLGPEIFTQRILPDLQFLYTITIMCFKAGEIFTIYFFHHSIFNYFWVKNHRNRNVVVRLKNCGRLFRRENSPVPLLISFADRRGDTEFLFDHSSSAAERAKLRRLRTKTFAKMRGNS